MTEARPHEQIAGQTTDLLGGSREAVARMAKAVCAHALLAPAGAIGAVWLAAVMRWIAGDLVVPWDSKNQIYAFFRFLATSLHDGRLPFWNPYHYGGHPAVADPQSLIFAPAFVVWALFDAAPSLRAFDLIVFGHLLVGGLAVGAIGLRARWPASACVLAAVLFMFGGTAAGRLQHTLDVVTYALFPPALLLLQVALQRRSLLAAAGFAVVAAILLLGRNQVALLLCFVLAAAAVAEIANAGQPLAYVRQRRPVLAVMTGLGLALTAVPMLLTLQFAALSNRPAELVGEALKGSLYPANLATLAVADIFGTHAAYWGPNGSTVPAVAYTDDSFNYLFIGSTAMVLLLWFGIVGRGAWRRGRILLGATIVLAIVYMLGRYTPLFALAYDWVPGVAKFRRPVDAGFVLMAMLALLCGHLLADYVRDGLPPRRLPTSVVVAAGALAVVAAGVVFSARTGHAGAALRAVLMTVPIPALVIVVLARARTAQARTYAAMVVTAVAIAELMWWNVAFRLNAEAHKTYSVLEHPTAADAKALAVLERALAERHAHGRRPRVEVLGVGGPWQNVPVVWGLEATNGYNPLRIGLYDRLIAPGESNWMSSLRDFPPTFSGYDCPLARALGLEYVVLGRPIEKLRHLAHSPPADLLQAGPPIWIYRLPNPTPRVTFTDRVEVADADATDASGHLLDAPAAGRALVDDDTPPSRKYVAAPDAAHAHIVSWSNDAISIAADSKTGGVLVLHAPYYPGWVATVDGRNVPILRADVLFRGVEVPPGAHHVRFEFRPFSLGNLADALALALHGRS